ncbi:hypothetical protein N7488_011487 [Penicillium malachiteum]|nr:hypothetical protein N7488_011487 [Penicillium malachiteum]
MRPAVYHSHLKPAQSAYRRLNSTRSILNFSSTSAMDQPRNTKAPWRDLLDSHLKRNSGYEFNIATIARDSDGDPVPRVRTCGYRGFFPELDLHPSGQKDMDDQVGENQNPPIYESDMLTFTTDSRMEKLDHLKTSARAIEAMFWLKDTMTQWRVKGRAYHIGGPSDPEKKFYEHLARDQIGKGLRVKENQDGDTAKWTWDNAVTKYFANHSPVMRGSFRNPPPGQPRSEVPSDSNLKLGQRVTDLYDPIARANFRVVVIIPEDVERIDLFNQEDIQREKWTYLESGHGLGHWKNVDLWP